MNTKANKTAVGYEEREPTIDHRAEAISKVKDLQKLYTEDHAAYKQCAEVLEHLAAL